MAFIPNLIGNLNAHEYNDFKGNIISIWVKVLYCITTQKNYAQQHSFFVL